MNTIGSFHIALSLVPLLLGGLVLTVLLLQWKVYSAFVHQCFVLFVWALTVQAVLGCVYLLSLDVAQVAVGAWLHIILSSLAAFSLHFYRRVEVSGDSARFFFALFSSLGSLTLVGISLSQIGR